MHDEPTFYFGYSLIQFIVNWIFFMTATINISNEILRRTDKSSGTLNTSMEIKRLLLYLVINYFLQQIYF